MAAIKPKPGHTPRPARRLTGAPWPTRNALTDRLAMMEQRIALTEPTIFQVRCTLGYLEEAIREIRALIGEP